MGKRVNQIIFVILAAMLLLQGCENTNYEEIVGNKIYTYEGDPFSELEDDNFTITINEDGTFTYYETLISSYIGIGKWTVKDDILTLTDDVQMGEARVNHFLIEGEDIVFIEKDSSNFIYVELEDGERFTGSDL